VSVDCNDDNAEIYPGATELATYTIDYDCDGLIGCDDPSTIDNWYGLDLDGDGAFADLNGDGAVDEFVMCTPDSEAAIVAATGGDVSILAYFNLIEYVTDPADPFRSTLPAADCADDNSEVHPGAIETCNSVDDDCDGGSIDEGGTTTWYADTDSDGYGDPAVTLEACGATDGYVTDNTDCDDTNASIHPGATETCNGLDDNCVDGMDEGLATTMWFADADDDGYGNIAVNLLACAEPSGYVENSTDCDDDDATINPSASEVACDGVDNDCDASTTDGVGSTWYEDNDHDGYGNDGMSEESCTPIPGYVDNNDDCNDLDAEIYPGADETCATNGIDNDCDGDAYDDAVDQITWYRDGDGDTYGDASVMVVSCTAPSDFVSDTTGDCDDDSATTYPGAPELLDGIDNNCDGVEDNDPVCKVIVDIYGGDGAFERLDGIVVTTDEALEGDWLAGVAGVSVSQTSLGGRDYVVEAVLDSCMATDDYMVVDATAGGLSLMDGADMVVWAGLDGTSLDILTYLLGDGTHAAQIVR
jgi:hypothetical protein